MVLDTMKESSEQLSVDEIWEQAVKKGLAAKIESQGKTPSATLGARIYTQSFRLLPICDIVMNLLPSF